MNNKSPKQGNNNYYLNNYYSNNTIRFQKQGNNNNYDLNNYYTEMGSNANAFKCILNTFEKYLHLNFSNEKYYAFAFDKFFKYFSNTFETRYQRYVECHQLIMQKTPLCHKMFSQCGKVIFHWNKYK